MRIRNAVIKLVMHNTFDVFFIRMLMHWNPFEILVFLIYNLDFRIISRKSFQFFEKYISFNGK